MPINKVQYGNQVLIDLTNSSLQSSDELVSGVTAYDRSGTKLTGTANYMPLIDNPTGDMVVKSNSSGEVEESTVSINDVATVSGDVSLLRSAINSKQDTLTAGDGIDITSNTISLDDYINLGSVADLNIDTTDLNPYGWYKGYFSGSSVLNKPTTSNTGTFLLQLQNSVKYARQIVIADYGIFTRNLTNGTWNGWINNLGLRAGDNITMSTWIECSGQVGSSASNIYFTIPIGKQVYENITRVTFSSLRIQVKGTSGTIISTTDVIASSTYSVVSTWVSDTNSISVTVSGFSGLTTHRPITVEVSSGTSFTFS